MARGENPLMVDLGEDEEQILYMHPRIEPVAGDLEMHNQVRLGEGRRPILHELQLRAVDVPIGPLNPPRPVDGRPAIHSPPEARDLASLKTLKRALQGNLRRTLRTGKYCYKSEYYLAPDGVRWRCLACHAHQGGDEHYTFVATHCIGIEEAVPRVRCYLCGDYGDRRQPIMGCPACSVALLAHPEEIAAGQAIQSVLSYPPA